MKVIEPGQDWKIAALRSSFHVHFLFGGIMESKFMDIAFEQAQKALSYHEVPIGAVIVKNGNVVAVGYNLKEKKKCCIEHAEMIAIREASNKLNNWRLEDCDLYVTLDPCPMCASAIKQARIHHVYSALENLDHSYSNIIHDIFNNNDSTNHSVGFNTNLRPNESKKILSEFFDNKRK